MEFGGGGEHCRRLRLRTGFMWHLVVIRGQPTVSHITPHPEGVERARQGHPVTYLHWVLGSVRRWLEQELGDGPGESWVML